VNILCVSESTCSSILLNVLRCYLLLATATVCPMLYSALTKGRPKLDFSVLAVVETALTYVHRNRSCLRHLPLI